MDGQAKEGQVAQGNPELAKIVDRIREHAEGEDEAGITFIKDKDPKAPEIKAANILYDGLMLTLQLISEDSLDKVNGDRANSEKYEKVLRAVGPVACAAAGLAEDRVPFNRATGAEEKFKERGDNVRIFTAESFNLGDTPYDYMHVFIRPKTYIRPSNVKPKEYPGRPQMRRLVETKQPRMELQIIPRDSSVGIIDIRLDQEDINRDMEITYDIVVGESDLIEDLKFSEDTGQRKGHHFNSGHNANELGVPFSTVLNELGDKIDRSIAKPEAKG